MWRFRQGVLLRRSDRDATRAAPLTYPVDGICYRRSARPPPGVEEGGHHACIPPTGTLPGVSRVDRIPAGEAASAARTDGAAAHHTRERRPRPAGAHRCAAATLRGSVAARTSPCTAGARGSPQPRPAATMATARRVAAAAALTSLARAAKEVEMDIENLVKAEAQSLIIAPRPRAGTGTSRRLRGAAWSRA